MAGASQPWELETVVHTASIVRKQRAMKVDAHLAFSFLCSPGLQLGNGLTPI